MTLQERVQACFERFGVVVATADWQWFLSEVDKLATDLRLPPPPDPVPHFETIHKAARQVRDALLALRAQGHDTVWPLENWRTSLPAECANPDTLVRVLEGLAQWGKYGESIYRVGRGRPDNPLPARAVVGVGAAFERLNLPATPTAGSLFVVVASELLGVSPERALNIIKDTLRSLREQQPAIDRLNSFRTEKYPEKR